MSKKNPQQLSDRDLFVAKWIAEQGAVRLTTVNKILENKSQSLEPRVLRSLAQRLVNNNLANKDRILTGPAILWPTAESMNLAGFKLKKGERVLKPSLSNLLHSILVAEVRVIYEANGAEWICERALRTEFTDHLPDGLAIFKDQKIIVEIDRTRKEKNRLFGIMMMNLSNSNYIVDYWSPSDLLETINRQKMTLPLEVRDRLRVFEIPKEAF